MPTLKPRASLITLCSLCLLAMTACVEGGGGGGGDAIAEDAAGGGDQSGGGGEDAADPGEEDAAGPGGKDAVGPGKDAADPGQDTGKPTPGAFGEVGRMEGFVAAHNEVRRGLDVGLKDLTWDEGLAAYADEWAEELATTKGCTIEHRPRSGEFAQEYGENLAWNMGFEETAENVTMRWASEVDYYDYDSNSCMPGEQCGHYTQIVWRGTERVGCALRVCDNGAEVWVCNYDPPGNFVGQQPY